MVNKVKVLIASNRHDFVTSISNALVSIGSRNQPQVIGDMQELLSSIKTVDEPVIIADKYFFGLYLQIRINIIKCMSKKAKILFCDRGTNQIHFGYRLYKIGADGFINGMENGYEFTKALTEFFDILRFFSEDIKEGISNGALIECRNFIAEITSTEMSVVLAKANGMASKEYPGMHQGQFNYKLLCFKRKCGITNDGELYILLRGLGLCE